MTVCSSCLRASCWQGAFYCDESHTTASLVEKTVAELEALGYEHSMYWEEGAGVDFPAGQKETYQPPVPSWKKVMKQWRSETKIR